MCLCTARDDHYRIQPVYSLPVMIILRSREYRRSAQPGTCLILTQLTSVQKPAGDPGKSKNIKMKKKKKKEATKARNGNDIITAQQRSIPEAKNPKRGKRKREECGRNKVWE